MVPRLALLVAVGYLCWVVIARPPEFGLPQDRFRFYFICIRRDIVTASKMALDHLRQLVERIWMVMARDHPLAPIDDFLQPDDSPYIHAMLDAERHKFEYACQSRGHSRAAKEASDLKWRTKHAHLFGYSRYDSQFTAGMELKFPAFMNLPARIQEMLDARGCGFPHPHPAAWNCSQSTISGDTVASTVLPGSIVWLAHRSRKAYCRDLAGLQGLWLSDAAWDSVCDLGEHIVTDMMGNAFCMASCAPVQTMSVLLLAHLEMLAHSHQVAALPPQLTCVHVDSDSQDDTWEFRRAHRMRRRRLSR